MMCGVTQTYMHVAKHLGQKQQVLLQIHTQLSEELEIPGKVKGPLSACMLTKLKHQTIKCVATQFPCVHIHISVSITELNKSGK